MTLVDSNINSEVKSVSLQENTTHKGLAIVQSPRWYILRYKILTTRIKDLLFSTSHEVFFPCRKVIDGQKATGKGYSFDKPIVPGYVFIRATFDEAKSFVQNTGLVLWRKRDADKPALSNSLILSAEERHEIEESMYYTIGDGVMRTFIHVVEYFRNDIKLYDATDIDVEQDDEVEFISGPMKGKHGFVRTQMRKSGGIVIVPLMTDSDNGSKSSDTKKAKTVKSNEKADDGKSRSALLHYGIPAKAEEYRIVRFANNTRNGESIKRATIKVKDLLEAYRRGATLEEKDHKRIKGYILRYSDTVMDTAIQRANRSLLLYRIYTILEAPLQLEKVKFEIETKIIHNFDSRIAAARGEHKGRIERQKAAFLSEIEYIDASHEERRKYIIARATEKE